MQNLEKQVGKISNLVRGVITGIELRNLVLTFYFLRYGFSKGISPLKYGPEKSVEEKDVEWAKDRFYIFYNFPTPKEFSVGILSLLKEVEEEFTSLYRVFDDLNIPEILDRGPHQSWKVFQVMSDFTSNLESNYKDGFDTLVQVFSEREGRFQDSFSTPASIRSVFKAVLGNPKTILDPTCGTGSLLGSFVNSETDLAFGQDINRESLALAKLRFAFEPVVSLQDGDSLMGMIWPEKKFEAVVINPPFNLKLRREYHDFPYYYLKYGQPPRSNANMLWLQIAISHIKEQGRAVVILPIGSLFAGLSEGKIRRDLVEDGWVESIISLPPNLFSHTSIPATVWVLSQNPSPSEVLMVDLSDAEIKGKTQTALPADVIKRLSVGFRSWDLGRGTQEFKGVPAISVGLDEIRENDYVLTPNRYLPNQDLEEYDLSEGIELRKVLSKGKRLPVANTGNLTIRKLSIKDLVTSVDQFELDSSSLAIEKQPKKTPVYRGNLLLIAKNGEKLKPSFLPEAGSDTGFALMNIFPFKVNESLVRIDYLIQELNKEYVHLQLSMYRSGTSISFVRLDDLLSIKVLVPSFGKPNSLAEQEALVKKEKEIRFQSLAELHGYKDEIAKLKEQQRKDLGSKKHNIMQHLNNVKSSSDVLLKFLHRNSGVLKAEEIINPNTGVTVLKRFQRLMESIDNVLFYAEHLTNDIEFGPRESVNIYSFLKECAEKGIQSERCIIKDDSDQLSFEEEAPIISISKLDFEELYNNLLENAIRHGFTDESRKYEFKYSVLIRDGKVEVLFENNGNPFPKGMGTKDVYCTRGEKGGVTGQTGEGSWKVCQIAQHFDAELEVIDEPKSEFPVGIKLTFKLVQ